MQSTTEDGLIYNITTGISENLTKPLVEFITNSSRLPASVNNDPTAETCFYDYLPSTEQYFTFLNPITLATAVTLSVITFILVFIFYGETLHSIIKNSPEGTKTHAAIVISIYPVVSVLTFCAVIVPRSQILIEALIHQSIMICIYHFFCLLITYCGGESETVNKINPPVIKLQTRPCCCWPCCQKLMPSVTLTKNRLRMVRVLVLQLPIVQAIIFLIELVMWTDNEIYQSYFNYFLPFVVTSVLSAIWGIIMMMEMSKDLLKDHFVRAKFIVLQLVLVLTKFQSAFARFAGSSNYIFNCNYPISPTLKANLLYNVLILCQMVLLCLIARMFYKKSIVTNMRTYNLPKHIPSIQQKIFVKTSRAQNINNINDNNNDISAKF